MPQDLAIMVGCASIRGMTSNVNAHQGMAVNNVKYEVSIEIISSFTLVQGRVKKMSSATSLI